MVHLKIVLSCLRKACSMMARKYTLLRFICTSSIVFGIRNFDFSNFSNRRVQAFLHPIVIVNCQEPPNMEIDSMQNESLAALCILHPKVSDSDLKRFLIARNWNVQLAAEMLTKAISWHHQHFPISECAVEPVLDMNCFYVHGFDREGYPIVYFRWGLFDSSRASAEQYMLVIGHILDYVLQSNKSSKVSIFVDLSVVDGGVNAYADLAFLRYVIQCASDNYPERLRHLILYPMPWYGMTVWKCLQLFVDRRSQEKLQFVPYSSTLKELPEDIVRLIDPDQIPIMFGGNYSGKLIDARGTFA